MVGFPGEKRRHFDNLLAFVSATRFDRMGAFAFHPEEGTEAEKMEGRVSDQVKQKRLKKLMALQEEISAERQEKFVGRVLDVLVERVYREAS